jgi:DNA-binding response OmpR family regulator
MNYTHTEKDTGSTRLSNHKVLLVEDDDFLSNLFGNKLVHEGCEYFHARTGEEALAITDRETPDVILLDLMLPGMNGFDVLASLRADHRFTSTPVLILSNLGQKEDIERCMALGATKYFIKAEHDLDDITNEIVNILKKNPKFSRD